MAQSNAIDNVLNTLVGQIKAGPIGDRKLQIELEKIMRKVYSAAINDNDGYCMTFKTPESDVLSVMKNSGIDLDVKTVQSAFKDIWRFPENSHMWNNPYYHLLSLFILYGQRYRNESIQRSALTLMLCKIWNGRRIRFMTYCNPEVMRYVVANLSGKYLAKKYDTPMSMIIQYFVPTLLDKYGKAIERDSSETKRLFSQCWCRIEQVFMQDWGPDLKSGKNKARGGLAPKYYEAYKKGLKISKPTTTTDPGDEDLDSTDFYSSNEFDEMINSIVNYITINVNPSYDKKFLEFVSKNSTVNSQAIELILNGMHNIRYTDYIRDILEYMFKQLQVDRAQICAASFMTETLKRRIISSKHSPNINQLKKLVDQLLEKIYDDVIRFIKYSNYSGPRRGHIRKVVFYGFAYNIQKVLCSGGSGGYGMR